jgi:diguanylate cyclase (GGDEF)-like protein
MLASLNATEMAFLQIAVLQAVAAVLWALGAALVRAERTAALHWAIYAALAASTWFGLAMHLHSPPLLTVLTGLGAAFALRRGIRLYTGWDIDWRGAALAVGIVVATAMLPGGDDWRPLQAVLNFGVLAAVYAGIAADLHRHARDRLRWRWPLLLAVAPLLGAAALAARAALALVQPGAVLTQMTVHGALNLGSALLYMVLVLLLHATLLVLVVSRLVGELQSLARRDPLTGVLNRRALLGLLAGQAERGRRATDTFSVMMIDIDHFKAVNDRYGHEAGDHALAQVARLMAQALRAQDCVGRFGGEEFVVLLPTAGLADACAKAEALREQVRSQPLTLHDGAVRLSVSIGVAEWAGPAEDPSRLLARADAALYRAKALGRDRVEADDAPVPQTADLYSAERS